MFSIVFRYIFQQLLVTFSVVSPILIFLMLLAMSVRYISIITASDVAFSIILKMLLYLTPGICGIILSICFLISSIIAIYNMQTRNEMTIFLLSGKSPISLLNPIITFGVLVSFVVYIVNTVVSPYAYKRFEEVKEQIQTKISLNILKPKSFNKVGNSIVYIGSRDNNTVNKIFISYIPNKKNAIANIITAKRGHLVVEDKKIFILLENGFRQEINKKNEVITTLTFGSLSYDITDIFSSFYKKSSKVNYKTQNELIKISQETDDEKLKKNYLAEYHSRIIMPFISLINALIIGLCLIKPQRRGRGKKSAGIAFALGIICYSGAIVLLNTATKHTDMIQYNYFLFILTFIGLFITFLLKRN